MQVKPLNMLLIMVAGWINRQQENDDTHREFAIPADAFLCPKGDFLVFRVQSWKLTGSIYEP